ncbi:MAG: zinc-dependent alcohol dehydrogenase family protein [Gammaproteobacteria bacterium]|nr:zinc-dependent alcohol dehydrogenase family protein [Gammaproteobacteria bacterium]
MRAILMTAAGGPEMLQLRDIPEPALRSAHEIKVRVRAAGVNPVDTKLRARGTFFPDAGPAVLGCDGAGVVVETGSAVTRFSVGDEVWFCDGGLGGVQGCYAEYKVLDEHLARRKPANVSFHEAAAAPLVLITAWEALHDRARVEAGDRILIHAAAGGVGHVAVQLAALAGARVMGVAGSTEKAEFVRNLGAETCIVRDRDFVAAALEWTGGEGVDLALDTVGGEVFRRSVDAVAHYGDLVTILEPPSDMSWKETRNRNLRIGFVLMLTPMLRELPAARRHQGDILDRCAELFSAGSLRMHVDRVLPLEEAAEAHRLIEAHATTGKLVLDTGGAD